MAANERWYFTKEQLENTPSRKCGIDAEKELSYRQQAANFIQEMGQRLLVTQLCINTAIVYMHRFYVYHSFTYFHRNAIAAASLFLAAKIEEQPRRLEHVIRVVNSCLHRDHATDTKSAAYLEQAQDLVFNEDVLLQTLGFEVAIDHPHTHVVRCCDLVGATKELARASYFMASNSLHLTTLCLRYKPTVVACFCIHLACKWANWQIPNTNDGKDWFSHLDKSVTSSFLDELTNEFLVTFEKCPAKLKSRMKTIEGQDSAAPHPKESDSDSASKRRRIKTSETDPLEGCSSQTNKLEEPGTSTSASSSDISGTKSKDPVTIQSFIFQKPSSSYMPPCLTKRPGSSSQQMPQPPGKTHGNMSQRKPNTHDVGNSAELINATKRFKVDCTGKKN